MICLINSGMGVFNYRRKLQKHGRKRRTSSLNMWNGLWNNTDYSSTRFDKFYELELFPFDLCGICVLMNAGKVFV